MKNFFNLVEKVLIKEHKDNYIFNLILALVDELKKNDNFKKIELIFIVRLLLHLGYFSEDFLKERKKNFFQEIKNIELNENEIKRFIREINQQLKKIAF